MKVRGLLGSLVLGVVGTLILQFLPSGAGQHFGIIGDYLHTGSISAQAGPGIFEVQAAFASGLGIDTTDTDAPAGPTARPVTFVGYVTVTTPQGTDQGCASQFDPSGPPIVGSIVADPLLEHVHVQASIPSTRFPGSVIMVDLTFEGSGEIQPDTPISSGPGDPVKIDGRAGLARGALVSGQVFSSQVGGGPVSSNGFIGRGAKVAIDYDPGCPIHS